MDKNEKRLEEFKPQSAAWLKKVEAMAKTLSDFRANADKRRMELADAKRAMPEKWAAAYVEGKDIALNAAENLRERIELSAILKGCTVAEQILEAERAKISKCKKLLDGVEKTLVEIQEGERNIAVCREELARVNPAEEGAVDKITHLQAEIKKWDRQRRGDSSPMSRGLDTLDECGRLLGEAKEAGWLNESNGQGLGRFFKGKDTKIIHFSNKE